MLIDGPHGSLSRDKQPSSIERPAKGKRALEQGSAVVELCIGYVSARTHIVKCAPWPTVEGRLRGNPAFSSGGGSSAENELLMGTLHHLLTVMSVVSAFFLSFTGIGMLIIFAGFGLARNGDVVRKKGITARIICRLLQQTKPYGLLSSCSLPAVLHW